MFADAEDERAQYTMLIGQVAARLRRDAVSAGNDGAVRIAAPARPTTRSSGRSATSSSCSRPSSATTRCAAAGSPAARSPAASTPCCAGSARRSSRSTRSSAATWRTGASGPSPPQRAQVTVVDLHNLPDRAQRFVVGVTLRGEFARKERQGTARPLMFVVLDELNKYAPREGDSPIKQILLDVAERGRSLGVILIGAQQTASEVERRILANCAIRVAGRLDAGRGRAARVRLPAARPARSGRCSPSRAPCSSPSPTSRCR